MSEYVSHIQNFYSFLLKERNYSKNTAIAYLKDVEQYFLFAADETWFPNSAQVRIWIRRLLQAGKTERTVQRKVSSLRTYAKYLYDTQRINKLITLELNLPKVKRKLPSYIKVKEMNLVLNNLEEKAVDFQSMLPFVIVSTFYHTGLRRSELIQLQQKDFDLNRKEVKVVGKGNKERLVPMSNELMRIIEEFILFKKQECIENEYFFCTFDGKKLKEKWVYSLVNELLNQTYGEKKSPHILRHSFATHLLQNGADINAIKELLGHGSLSATQLYAHNDIARLKEVYRDSHPFSD